MFLKEAYAAPLFGKGQKGGRKGQKGAERGRKGQKGAERGRKGQKGALTHQSPAGGGSYPMQSSTG
jgi:hypothetical protein